MSDEELEYLTTTRERRSNAGSRLRQLLDLENDTQPQVSKFVTEDDENVDLLFAEDADDEEFQESEEDDEEEEEEDQDDAAQAVSEVVEDDEMAETAEIEGEPENIADELDSSDAGPVDSDDVLSDSDISLSDTDEEEGEKELAKHEKSKKRKQKLTNRIVPKIKKFKPNEIKTKAKPKKRVTSESIMLSARKSSRASAIESKEALVQKLKEDEARRASLAPIVRIKQRELTQEEKLAEAVETEKANILSLELFQQQEVVKKERQKFLLQQKRRKMVNIIRWISKQEYITPNQEIEIARNLYYSLTSRSKKKNYKRIQKLFDVDLSRFPGEIDKSLPYYIQEEKERLEAEDAEKKRLEAEGIEVQGVEMEGVETEAGSDQAEKQIETDKVETNQIEADKESDQMEIDHMETDKVEPEPAADIEAAAEVLNVSEQVIEDEKNAIKANPTEVIDTKEDTVPENNEINEEGDLDEDKRKTVTFADNVKEPEPEVEISEVVSEVVSEPVSEHDISMEIEEEQIEEEPEIFAGPPQKVARNLLELYEFTVDKPLNESNLKKFVLGEDALLTGSRRFKDLKTILKVGNAGNPYAKVKEEKDELFTPATALKEDNPIFEELNRLPQLGIRQEIIEETIQDNSNDSNIVIKTEAPLGLYLPNGNKKACLVTGTEVKYFDPSLGVPYSDVETFKLLKSIEQGELPWYTFDGEYNHTGATELYLGSRDGTFRHARGVPEGFN